MKNTLTFWAKRCTLLLLLSMSTFFVKAQAPIVVEPVFGVGTVGVTASTGSADACLTYSNQASNTGANKTYAATVTGVDGTITYSWSIVGGATIVGSTTGSSVTVKPTIQTNRFNKARLYLNYTGTKKETVPNPCPPYTGTIDVDVATTGRVFVDLYQQFTYTDPIVGEACIESGKTYAFSIRDMVSGNIELGIGTDIYDWNTNSINSKGNREYESGDNSAIAFKFTSNIDGGEQIFVQVGKCNSTSIAHTFGKTIPDADYEIVGYAGCIPTSINQIQITNTEVTGIEYRWELGNSNYTFAGTSNTDSQDGITVNIGTEGGTIYLYSKADPAGSDYCTSDAAGEIVAVIQIKRSLDEGVSLSGPTCVHPSTYNYSLTPNVNTPLNWELPYGWTIDGANQNASNVNITVANDADFGVISISTTTCPGDGIDVNVFVRPDDLGEISTASLCLSSGSTTEVVFSVDEVDHTSGYVWTLPAGWNFKLGTATDGAEITVIPNGTNGGTVSVYAQGNCANSNTASIEMKLTPVTPGTITRDQTACINEGLEDLVTFTVPNDPNVTSYTWDLDGIGTGSSTTNSIAVTTSGVSGTYLVRVRANNACGSSSYSNINVPITGLTFDLATFKVGSLRLFSLDPDPVVDATYYKWYWNGSLYDEGTDVTAISIAGNPASGTACVEITGTNGCITRKCLSFGGAMRMGAMGGSGSEESFSEESVEEVVVYPNPANALVKVSFNNASTHTIKLIDTKGNLILSTESSDVQKDLDVSAVATGMYFVVIQSENGTVSKKVQIVR
jgi:hypothetical protein